MRALTALRMAALAVAGLGVLGAAPERGDPVSRISGGARRLRVLGLRRELRLEGAPVRALPDHERVARATPRASPSATSCGRTARSCPFAMGVWRATGRSARAGAGCRSAGVGSTSPAPRSRSTSTRRSAASRSTCGCGRGPRASAGPELPDTAVDVLALAAPIEGTVWFTGMAEPQHAARPRRHHPHLDGSARVGACRAPDRFLRARRRARALPRRGAGARTGGARRSLSVERDGKPILNVTEITISHGDEKTIELGAGYPIPRQLIFTAEGISGVIHLNQVLVRHEPLQDLPLPFRFLLSSAAHPQRVWMDSRFEVRIEQGPSSTSLQAQGSGITSVTFTNPLPSATSTASRD